jgi:hypothetical protein
MSSSDGVDWILGFGSDEGYSAQRLCNTQLMKFAELAFLRKLPRGGPISHPSSIRQTANDGTALMDSITRALCIRELLWSSSVIIIRPSTSGKASQVEELVFSTQRSPWGFPLPGCPSCGNHNVAAKQLKESTAYITLRCSGCNRTTDGKGATRPKDVVPLRSSPYGFHDRYFLKPLHLASPWMEHTWREASQKS